MLYTQDADFWALLLFNTGLMFLGGGAQDSASFTSLWGHLFQSMLSKWSCRFAGATPGFLSSRDFEYSKIEVFVPLSYETEGINPIAYNVVLLMNG